MKKILKHIVFIFWGIMPFVAFSQSKFYVKGNATAATGSNYKLSFVLENAQGSNFKPPASFPGFNVLSGPNQNSSFQWINGKTSSSISYVYFLQAHTVGTTTIPSASIKVKGETLSTEPLEVTITKGKEVSKNDNKQGSGTNDDWKKQVEEGMFVKMYADKTNPYVGEQITVYAKLYQSIPAYNTSVKELPEFVGFWNQQYDLKDKQDWQDEVVDGKPFKTLLIGKYALFPQKDGELTIEPFKLSTVIRIQERRNYNPFDLSSFFNRNTFREERYDFESTRITVNVKPLPIENQPESFTGAVGSYDHDLSLDSLSYKTGKAIRLSSRVTGTGNIMMLNMPSIDFPEELEVFDPESNEYISKTSNKVNGKQTDQYVLIADRPGNYFIPPVEFSYFDPKTEQYNTVTSDKVHVKVTGKPIFKTLPENKKEELGNEESLSNIALDYDLSIPSKSFANSGVFYSLLGGAPVSLLLFLFILRKKEEYTPDTLTLKGRRAARVARKKLSKADALLKAGNKEGYYKEINQALWSYVSDKLHLPASELSKEHVEKRLTKRMVSGENISPLFQLIEKSEVALYSPLGVEEMSEDYKRATEIIIAIENEIH